MKKFPWIAAIALVGCTHASIQVNSSGATSATITSVSAGVSGHASPAMWALIGIGLIAAEAANPTRPIQGRPDALRAPAPGALDSRRRVNEVDCTKPIRNWTANLKCK
jgi:hypothetical protein